MLLCLCSGAVVCALVITARPDLECCHRRIRSGSRGRGPRLMEAKQPPAPAPAVQKSAFRGKTRATSQRSRNTIRQYERQFNPLIWICIHPTPPSSSTFLNPAQISGPWGEEIVVHFLTNWVKRTLSRALRKQMVVFITGGHWWLNGGLRADRITG